MHARTHEFTRMLTGGDKSLLFALFVMEQIRRDCKGQTVREALRWGLHPEAEGHSSQMQMTRRASRPVKPRGS